jgi:hypothetical protein
VDDDEYLEELLTKAEGSGIGHNSEAEIISRVNNTINNLIKLSEDHAESLQALVDKQENEREELLLTLGPQLLAGRRRFEEEDGTFKNPRGFGDWIKDNFPNLSLIVNEKEVTAIVWAAEYPHQRQEMLDKYPRVKTTRGAYAKWEDERKEREKKEKAQAENTTVNPPSENNETPPPTDQKPNVTGTNTAPSTTTNTNSGGSSNGINTKNPDTTEVKIDATMLASSLIGVVTNMTLFEATQERLVRDEELASAIFEEIRTRSVEQLTNDQIEEYVESKLKPTLEKIARAIPLLCNLETNVVRINKAKEIF